MAMQADADVDEAGALSCCDTCRVQVHQHCWGGVAGECILAARSRPCHSTQHRTRAAGRVQACATLHSICLSTFWVLT